MAEKGTPENLRIIPPTPKELIQGNISGRPGIALPTEKQTDIQKTPEPKKTLLGPTSPTKYPKRGWWK